MAIREPVNNVTGTVLRPRAPAIAVSTGPSRPVLNVRTTVAGTRIVARPWVVAALPMGGIALRSRRGLPMTIGRTLALLHRIGTRLDHEVITRLTRSARRLMVVRARLIALMLIPLLTWWPTLPLPMPLFGTRLIVATLPLLALLLAMLLPTIRATLMLRGSITSLFGQRLTADTQADQTSSSQTPDARFHGVPHEGLGRQHKTEKPGSGSAEA